MLSGKYYIYFFDGLLNSNFSLESKLSGFKSVQILLARGASRTTLNCNGYGSSGK